MMRMRDVKRGNIEEREVPEEREASEEGGTSVMKQSD